MSGARWLLAFYPGAPRALLRLKVDTTLWEERSRDGTWTMFKGQPATLLDVSDQMPRILDMLVVHDRGSPVAFRVRDQQLVGGDEPATIGVDTHADFQAALAHWRAGRRLVGCP
jgi:hypothetical protein